MKGLILKAIHAAAESRPDPGHAGHADSQSAQPGADARLWHRAPHRAGLTRRLQSESRVPSHGLPAARARGLARFRMASDREFASREVLLAHPRRTQTAGRGSGRLEPPRIGDHAPAESRGIERCPYGAKSIAACGRFSTGKQRTAKSTTRSLTSCENPRRT